MFKTRVVEAVDRDGGKLQLYVEMDSSQRYGRVSSFYFSSSFLFYFVLDIYSYALVGFELVPSSLFDSTVDCFCSSRSCFCIVLWLKLCGSFFLSTIFTCMINTSYLEA